MNNWISVNDSLPSEEMWVKIKVNNIKKNYDVKIWTNKDVKFINSLFEEEKNVTHWRPA